MTRSKQPWGRNVRWNADGSLFDERDDFGMDDWTPRYVAPSRWGLDAWRGYSSTWRKPYEDEVSSYTLDVLCSAISSKFGVSLHTHTDGQRWFSDVEEKRVYIPKKECYTNADIGVIIHEAAHIRFSSPFKTLSYDEKMHDALLASEDVRIEKKITNVYPRAENYIRMAYEKEDDEGAKGTGDAALIARAMVRGRHGDTCKELISLMSIEARIAFETLPKDWRAKVEACETTESMLEYLKTEVFPILAPFFKEPPKVPEANMHAKHMEGKTPEGSQEMKYKRKTFSWEQRDEHWVKTSENASLGNEFMPEINQALESATKMRRIMARLRDSLAVREVGNQDGGKIDGRRMWKLASGVSAKVFKRRTAQTDVRPALFVMADASGSMNGARKMYQCIAATVLLAKACEALGIPVAVMAFNGEFMMVKEYGERVATRRMANRYAAACRGEGGGSTCDNYAIIEASKLLARRPESKKALFVLSDGQPSPCIQCNERMGGIYDDGDEPDAAEALKKTVAETSKKARVIGVGICSHHVTSLYPESRVVGNASGLPEALTDIFNSITAS